MEGEEVRYCMIVPFPIAKGFVLTCALTPTTNLMYIKFRMIQILTMLDLPSTIYIQIYV